MTDDVIFEGFRDTIFNIKETEMPKPILTYAKVKVQNERDIVNSNLDYIILRLSSVYGYNDNMRLSILPNLFSKLSSQNKTLKLFGGGLNYKPLVCVNDVARFILFCIDKNISKEIYNVTSENHTVKDIGLLCKEILPNLDIAITNDEIPNLGYTLSNDKILSTGFVFNTKVKDSLKEMINMWKLNVFAPPRATG